MAYENVRITKPNMAVIDSYFYYLDETRDALIVKVADGDSAFHYPTDSPIGTTVKSLQYDGYYLWSMQDDSGGFIIKCWELDNFICRLKNTFTYHDDAYNNYQSSAFGVECYIAEFSQSMSSRSATIYISNYYDTVITSGTTIVLGPNTYGQSEEVTVSGINMNKLTLIGRTSNIYSFGDKITIRRSLFVFNDYNGTSSDKGSIIRFDTYDGSYIASMADVEYKNIKAATFCNLSNILPGYSDIDSLLYIKGTNAKLCDISDFVTLSGSHTDTLNLYGTANIETVRTDQSTVIPVYDVSIVGGTMYRLQLEGTYYGTNNSWSTYNYQTTPMRPFIDFITVGADPVILPANGKNVSVITAVVNDQYGNPANNKPVSFTEDNAVGFMTSPVVYTGDYYYNPGVAKGVYKAGVDVTPVFIEATVTQYD